MDIFPHNTNYDFLGKSRQFLTLSAIVVTLSLVLVFFGGNFGFGLVFGVDFRGGSDVIVAVEKGKSEQAKVEEILKESGYVNPAVQLYSDSSLTDKDGYLLRLVEVSSLREDAVRSVKAGLKGKNPDKTDPDVRFDERSRDKLQVFFQVPTSPAVINEALATAGLKENIDYTLRGRAEGGSTYVQGESSRSFQVLPTGVANDIVAKLSEKLGAQVQLLNATSVGPKAGEQLRNDGIKAILFSMLLIMLFVALRFDFRYAPGAVVAILHDVAIAAGVFVLARIEFNLPAIAALLTITGYSLNDTIVVYDRIRENSERLKGKPLAQIANISVNEMLNRTLLVSGSTLLATSALMIFGGDQIRGFAIALFAGIVVGTYSSIYIAAPIVLWADAQIKARGLDKPAQASAADLLAEGGDEKPARPSGPSGQRRINRSRG
jgi:preprotein translocase subunit SecF